MAVLETLVISLSDFCKESGLSQRKVGNMVGISQQAILEMIQRKRSITLFVDPKTDSIVGWSEIKSPGRSGS